MAITGEGARAPAVLLACGDAAGLGVRLGQHLGVGCTPSRDVWFACGEGKHVIDGNVRGCDVYVLQNVAGPSTRTPYERLVMLLHAIDAARCADAARVTAVVPYLPGTRQDKRKDHIREGVSTGLFARLLATAGADMVVTLEPHTESLVGCFDPTRCVLEAVSLSRPFARFLRDAGVAVDVVASTDLGGLERARVFAEELGCGLAALSKERDYASPSKVVHTTVVGDVDGKRVLLVDDIIDTGGSVVSAVEALWSAGARDVTVAGVHLLLSAPAPERLHALSVQASRRGFSFALAGSSAVPFFVPGVATTTFELDPLLADIIATINRRGSVRALE
jgi:ribose-phosphate pyrophosphokinase